MAAPSHGPGTPPGHPRARASSPGTPARGRTPASVLLAVALAACTPEPPPPRPDGGTPDGGVVAPPEAPGDAGLRAEEARRDGGASLAVQAPSGEARPAGAAPLVSAEVVLPDGTALPLSRDGATVVEPSARFRLEVAARLPDARLSLLDAQEAMAAADADVEVAAATRFTLTPAAPLRPGSSYTLRLDGAEERLMRAEDGRRFEPVSMQIKVAGDPPAAPPRKAKRARRRR